MSAIFFVDVETMEIDDASRKCVCVVNLPFMGYDQERGKDGKKELKSHSEECEQDEMSVMEGPGTWCKWRLVSRIKQ